MEQALLGSMLVERPAIEKAVDAVQPDDFYRDAHRVIYDAITALYSRDEPVDLLTLQEQLRSVSSLERIGGAPYLVELSDAVPTAANVEHYARVVQEKALLRRLIDAANQVNSLAHSEYDTIDDVVDQAERAVFAVAQDAASQLGFLDPGVGMYLTTLVGVLLVPIGIAAALVAWILTTAPPAPESAPPT